MRDDRRVSRLAVLASAGAFTCLAAGCGATQVATSTRATTAPVATVGARHRILALHGVEVTVPVDWPLQDGSHTPLCGAWSASGAAFIGPQPEAGISCPTSLPGSSGPSELDGVWLQVEAAPPGAQNVTLPAGQAVAEVMPGSPPPVNAPTVVYYHGASVEIGTATPSPVTAAVLASLRYDPNVADTPVSGACGTTLATAAPLVGERLAQHLVLDHGNVTLDRPAATDHATVAAPTGPPGPATAGTVTTEQSKLYLARYGAAFPASLGPHGNAPMYTGVLAWVIYSRPITDQQGCGLWGVYAFDAHTGAQIANSGWSPGP